MKPIEIGYLCARGHYCFYADPAARGECGSKSIGSIFMMPDRGIDPLVIGEAIDEASQHLGAVIEPWRTQ